jgi:hypothetical protein
MKSLFAPAALAGCLLGLFACKGAEVASTGSAPARAGGAGGGIDASFAPPPALDAAQIDLGAGDPGATPPAPANMTCGEQSQKAQQVPLALMLVVDGSSSMLTTTGAGTASKYQQVEEALQQFVAAPGSAGLGLGLAFFPQPGGGSACESDVDCGFVTAPTPPPCQLTSVCAKTVTATGVAKSCGGGRATGCPAGDTCVPLGHCLVSLDDCTNIGEPCAGGTPGDTCMAVGKTCEFTDEQSCATEAYEQPSVPIVQLPNPGQRLVARAFARRSPSGSTPLRPAIEGALVAMKKYLAAHPGQTGALVLATDGVPSGCQQNTVADVAKLLQDARSSGIATYVIGVATPNDANERALLGQLASAGGTGMPFVISATEVLSQRFLETLNQIRGQALPCEFSIPKPTGGAIDFLKVNMHWQSPGAQEDVLYTGSAARCDATRGGWYYDADPSATPPGNPTRVIVCPATCAKLKMQPDATVDLRFGCATRTID